MSTNEKIKIVLWGSTLEYENYVRCIEPEVLKGYLEIIGLVFNDGNGLKSWDGLTVIQIEELPYIDTDFIIDMIQIQREFVDKIKTLLNLDNRKIIPVSVFNIPGFDFVRYLRLKLSQISIISAHCWGGMVYNYLGLEFLSPLINMYEEPGDFIKLADSLAKYMAMDVEIVDSMYDEGLKHFFPIGQVDDVKLFFQHYSSNEEALSAWNRRRDRINYNNLFLEMVCKSESDIEGFLKLNYPNKIAFTDLDVKDDRIIVASAGELDYIRSKYGGNLPWFMCDMAINKTPFARKFDILKLFLGEKDFMR